MTIQPLAERPRRLTYTVAEAADVLGISVSLLYRLIRTNECPVPTIGTRRALRLPARLVQEWADGTLQQATPAEATP